ncbi:hypothetical protein MKX01_042424 [Papaver californicum]|nr:hypothetical protein MKX01_042424 [Papaver californicum]
MNLLAKNSHGNRESVRKYRERKKVRLASIEDEVRRLRNENQQLLERLQGLVALEQEAERIKGELGSFPYQDLRNDDTGVIPQNMPGPSTSVGAYDVNQCDRPPIPWIG